MGYYTRYRLEIAKENFEEYFSESVFNAIRNKFNKILEYNNHIFDYIYNEYSDEWTWYGHTKDMRQLAKAFPKFYFTLYGEGEAREDMWIEQYHGNEFYMDTAKIIKPKRKW